MEKWEEWEDREVRYKDRGVRYKETWEEWYEEMKVKLG